MPSSCRKIRQSHGFTLLEVIITLSIIVVLGSFVYFGGDYGLESRALKRANADLHMLLKNARSQAILEGRDARLIINLDNSNPERFLRYAGIIVRDGGDSTLWKATHGGLALPEGIYFVPQNITGVNFGNWDVSVTERKSIYRCSDTDSTSAVVNVLYPLTNPVSDSLGTDPVWAVYQFSPDGHLDTVDATVCGGGIPSTGNRIILAPAVHNASGDVEFNNSENILGVRIKQNGTSVAVADPLDL